MKFAVRVLKRGYQSISPEQYLLNQRSSRGNLTPIHLKLGPLPGANHSPISSEDLLLVGCSKTPAPEEDYDEFKRALMVATPDLVFLQLDPSRYVARQRFLAHKCALNKLEDYSLEGVKSTTLVRLAAWEEAVVNLINLDMLRQNKLQNNLQLNNSFYTYCYPEVRKENDTRDLTTGLLSAIDTHVVRGLASEYPLINKALFNGLMSKQKVMLGGMPETLYRMVVAGSLTLSEMRDIFKTLKARQAQSIQQFSLKELGQSLMPHVFNAPKDLYMTALLKEMFQATVSPLAIVGMPHLRPVKEYWVPPPHGINMTQATRVNRLQESDDARIEKQALLDVLFGTKLWSQDFVSNPFVYLVEDVTKIGDQDLAKMKSCFMGHYRKYRQQLRLLQDKSQVLEAVASEEQVRRVRSGL